jgi:hypothetical protein
MKAIHSLYAANGSHHMFFLEFGITLAIGIRQIYNQIDKIIFPKSFRVLVYCKDTKVSEILAISVQ